MEQLTRRRFFKELQSYSENKDDGSENNSAILILSSFRLYKAFRSKLVNLLNLSFGTSTSLTFLPKLRKYSCITASLLRGLNLDLG